MPTNSTPRRDAKKAGLTLTAGNHARLCRRAAAHGVSNNRYCQLALEFLLDCEDAFGGPLTEQFRAQTVNRFKLAREKFNKLISEV